MWLIVVRHAIAKSKHAWTGPDQDRPLTTNGLRHAKAISAHLTRYRIDRVISSPSLRCIQTVAPLGSGRHLHLELTEALAPDGGHTALPFVDHLIRGQHGSAAVVLCTHREVLVEVLPALASRFGVTLGHRLPGAKGGCWTLLFRKQNLVSVKYWRPGG